MKNFIIILVMLLTVLTAQSQIVVTVTPTKDAMIFEDDSLLNSGTWEVIAAGLDWGQEANRTRSVIEFDVSMIPKDAVIVSADLQLFGYDHFVNKPPENDCYLYANDFPIPAENIVNWNNAPKFSINNPVLIKGTIVNPDASDRIVSIKDFVQDWVSNPTHNYGMTMTLADEFIGARNFMAFKSKEYEPAILTISYDVPVVTCKTIPITKDAEISTFAPTTNYGKYPEFIAMEWTSGGTPFTARSLLEVDLSSIPIGQTITSAQINLYGINSTSNHTHSILAPATSNAPELDLITSPWNESTVTWNSMPNYTTSNQVTHGDFKNTDDWIISGPSISNLVEDWYSGSIVNNGLMLKMQSEIDRYKRVNFGSSESVDTIKVPTLKVCYEPEPVVTCKTIPITKDAEISTFAPTTNYGKYPEFIAMEWTSGGTPFTARSLLEVDLSSIPIGQTITSAQINLYGINSTSNHTHSILAPATSNAPELDLITSPWNESTVTWNSMPNYTTSNQVTHGDFKNTDDWIISGPSISNLVQDWYSGSIVNNGLMLKMQSEIDRYKRVNFGSSESVDTSKVPTLKVCYAPVTVLVPVPKSIARIAPVINETRTSKLNTSFNVYPNPSNDIINIELNGFDLTDTKIEVYDFQGKLLDVFKVTEVSFSISAKKYSKGVYCIRITDSINSSTKKIIIN